MLAFNLSAELVYTNVLNLIDLAGLPLHAADRGGADALVVAGGHCAYNPEPLADFVDAFVLGDGEEVVGEINEVMAAWLAASPPEARDRPACCARWPASRASTSRALRPRYEDGRLVATLPGDRRGARRGRPSGRSATWPTGPTRPARSSR